MLLVNIARTLVYIITDCYLLIDGSLFVFSIYYRRVLGTLSVWHVNYNYTSIVTNVLHTRIDDALLAHCMHRRKDNHHWLTCIFRVFKLVLLTEQISMLVIVAIIIIIRIIMKNILEFASQISLVIVIVTEKSQSVWCGEVCIGQTGVDVGTIRLDAAQVG